MGLFGGKKVFVASTLYNMSGPIEERVDYLKSLIAGNVISNSRFSMGETIQKGYINGPGIKARSFYRWALDNYDEIGVPRSQIRGAPSYAMADISAELPHEDGESVRILRIEYGFFDPGYWAEQWILENIPELINTNWVVDSDEHLNEITITFEDTSTTTFSIGDPKGFFLYVTYTTESTYANTTTHIYIYKIGSGNAVLDNARSVEAETPGGFLPYIPVRLDNEFLSDTYMPEAYEAATKAYKKLTNSKFDKLVDKVADNESLDDIDHAYVCCGVSLNVYDNSARKYLFHFFEKLVTKQRFFQSDYTNWQSSASTYNNQIQEYWTWKQDYEAVGGITDPEDPNYPGPRPIVSNAPIRKPITALTISSLGETDSHFHVQLDWSYIMETSGNGLKKPDATKGEVWFTIGDDVENGAIQFLTGNGNIAEAPLGNDNRVELHYQIDENNWKTLTIVGLVHRNKIYKTKAVEITAKEALEDIEESGFLVPLHYETLREMSLIESTQLMTAGVFMVFNSYEVVKQKWYETTIFKIFVFVVVIAITAATMGGGAGLLGAAASVGASLGFSGLMAVIVGAIANAIAGMILMQIIQTASVAVFGDKLGMIIATVASVIAMNVGTGLMAGQSAATAWGNMMSAQNIISMTSSVGQGIAGYINASTMELQQQTQDLIENYEKEAAELQQKYLDTFGYGTFVFDPNILTNNNPYGIMEMPQTFLDRTLMTGIDIAEMTNGMLSDFASLTLDTSTMGR